ncbi:hypothetical protein CRUP_002257 [Coryphaenoides rupestris]|nr:hypothetical protein CRUP_002257 [Coryphaenoides rupestris]
MMALVTVARRLLLPRRASPSAWAAHTGTRTPGTGPLGASRPRALSTCTQMLRSDNKVTVHFVNRDGEKITAKGSPGDSLLDLDVYDSLGPVTDEEMDMLDLAYGLTDTSRLGCQVCLTKALDGMEARVPESVADIRQSQDGSSS